jgi:hypothetical protein
MQVGDIIVSLPVVPAVAGFIGGIIATVLGRTLADEVTYHRKRQHSRYEWYEAVERTATGILRVWVFSNGSPSAAEWDELSALVGDLRQYRRHQLATATMVEQINDIIEAVETLQPNAGRGTSFAQSLPHRVTLRNQARALHSELNQAQKTPLRRVTTPLYNRGVDYKQRAEQWLDSSCPPGVPEQCYRELRPRLSDEDFLLFGLGELYLYDADDSPNKSIFYDTHSDSVFAAKLEQVGPDTFIAHRGMRGTRSEIEDPLEALLPDPLVNQRINLRSVSAANIYRNNTALMNSCPTVEDLDDKVFDVQAFLRTVDGVDDWVSEIAGLEAHLAEEN